MTLRAVSDAMLPGTTLFSGVELPSRGLTRNSGSSSASGSAWLTALNADDELDEKWGTMGDDVIVGDISRPEGRRSEESGAGLVAMGDMGQSKLSRRWKICFFVC